MRALLILGLCCLSFLCNAQNQVFFTGFFPELSFTKKLANENRINFKIENQHILFNNSDEVEDKFQFKHYRTDIMAFYDYRISPTKSISLGLFHRFQEDEDGNRIIQQFLALKRLRSLRLTHRLRTDQTFTKNDPIEIRLRYRLSLEIPLNGATLDPGEHYLLLSGESIFSNKGNEREIENRLAFSWGKLFLNGQKLEWSIDYRTDGYVQKPFRTRLWAKVGYYFSL